MNEYEQSGHIGRVSNEITHDMEQCFLLPHHSVWKVSSKTTKLRTVFNGSMRGKSGKSLNLLLHAGSNLIPNLYNLICRWWLYELVFSADVDECSDRF